jgi:hemoglobin
VFDPKKLSPIGIKERDQWLACMDHAMVETGVDEALRARLNTSFFQTADWMRNKGE